MGKAGLQGEGTITVAHSCICAPGKGVNDCGVGGGAGVDSLIDISEELSFRSLSTRATSSKNTGSALAIVLVNQT